jgi:hypothetical protein
VVSQYERKYVFISDRDFSIPSLSFKSFDYVSKKSKRLTTKSYKVKIDGNMVAATTKVVTTPPKDRASVVAADQKNPKQGSSEANRSILEDTAYYKDREAKERIGYPLWALFLAFLMGVTSVLVVIKIRQWVTQRRGIVRRKHYPTKEALKILYPHTNHNKKVEAMVRKLYEIESGNSKVSIDKEELAKMIEQLTNKA